MRRSDRYYTYITTNQHRTVLYTGVTADLAKRLQQHLDAALFDGSCFTGRNQAHYCIWYETFPDIRAAIAREKEIKGWRREKKIALVNSTNPDWKFLNEDIW